MQEKIVEGPWQYTAGGDGILPLTQCRIDNTVGAGAGC